VVATTAGPGFAVENAVPADGEALRVAFEAIAVPGEPASAEAAGRRLDVHPLSTMTATTASVVAQVARRRVRAPGWTTSRSPPASLS
jgi:hypothetical protein